MLRTLLGAARGAPQQQELLPRLGLGAALSQLPSADTTTAALIHTGWPAADGGDPRDQKQSTPRPRKGGSLGEYDEEGWTGFTPSAEAHRQHLNSEEASFTTGIMAGMPKPGDYKVKELNEAGEVVGETGPDPNAPRGSIWHKQTVEGAMGNDSEGAPDPNRANKMDRRSPAGPVASDLDPQRPVADDTTKERMDSGGRVVQRVKEVVSGVAETLSHGVNNAGQPQIIEELKRTSPEGGGEQAALKQPHNTAGRDRQQ